MDRRTALLMRHLRDEEYLPLVLDDSGAVSLGSEHVGRLDGFRFAPDPRAGEGIHGRTLRAATLKGLEGEITTARARALIAAPDAAISLSEHGRLWWSGAVVAKLGAGPHALTPVVELLAGEQLRGALREEVQARLTAWMQAHIARLLDPLAKPAAGGRERAAPCPITVPCQGSARGLAFQLAEGDLGQIDRMAPTLPHDLRAAAQPLQAFPGCAWEPARSSCRSS